MADADLSQPTRWRLQHGGFGEQELAARPGAAPPSRSRVVDTLGQMLVNGTITAAMHEAGTAFRGQFRAAAHDALRVSPLVRLPRTADTTPTDRQLAARRRVDAALNALGGAESAAGSCAWHVLGLECSVREWAARQGWGGRPIGHAQAQGILVAALGVLAGHYRCSR